LSDNGFLRIRNWDNYQNADIFKKSHGKPPWIKLFVHKDYELEKLPIAARLLFFELLKVSGRYSNVFPNDSQWLVGEVRMTESEISEGLAVLLQGAWLSRSKSPRRSRKIREESEKDSPLEENRRDKPPNPLSGKAKNCSVCGPIALPRGVTLADHLYSSHGIEPLRVVEGAA
jgi:hypothetical protein